MNEETKRVVWITGASSGVGLVAARQLASRGFTCVLSARDSEALQRAGKELGPTVDTIPLDVTDNDAIEGAARDIVAKFGRLDVLVANAGGNVPRRAWSEVSVSDFDRLVSVNLNSVFYCVKAVLPVMRKQKSGLIITVGSWAGRFVGPGSGPGYTAAKFGAASLTSSINLSEYKNGIRATILNPGEINSPAQLRRQEKPKPETLAAMLTPEDLARTICFIAEAPSHVCFNEIVVSPTWNRMYADAPHPPSTGAS